MVGRLFSARRLSRKLTPQEDPVTEPMTDTAPRRMPLLLTSGHRPFFLLAAISATIGVPLWVAALEGYLPLAPAWHGHEMLYGFAVAALSGFALAAVPNWTGRGHVQGVLLALLVAAWLAGRIAMWFGLSPLLDLVYLPLLAVVVGIDIVAVRNRRNYQVPAIFLMLAAINAYYHYGDPTVALRAAAITVVALITLIGGRVVPAFTQNALRRKLGPAIVCRPPGRRDAIAVPLVLSVAVAELVMPGGWPAGVLAGAAGLVVAARMQGWHSLKTLDVPLLWILHVGYLWVAAALLLIAAARFDIIIDEVSALHALTTGAIGVMILAVGSRAALGHSGRPLVAGRATVACYVLVIAAALLRVFASFDGVELAAGLLWTLGWGLFSVVYWPILARPRIDGKPE
jgi:uncharacterized protein involved in response to NO